jgi:hypothetical protein
MISVYSLTPEEIATIQALNTQRRNVLLVVCDFGSAVGVDPEALQNPEYADYLAALGGYDAERVVEVDSDAAQFFQDQKCAKHEQIEQWHNSYLAQGFVTPGGWAMKVSWEDQHTLASYLVLLKTSVELGYKTLESEAIVSDNMGKIHLITIADFQILLLAYGGHCEQMYMIYKGLLNQLESAKTIDDLDAIEIPTQPVEVRQVPQAPLVR